MSFRRATLDLLPKGSSGGGASIRSLPDLVRFCAIQNTEHLFILQEHDHNDAPSRITFGHFAHAVDRCCQWFRTHGCSTESWSLDQPATPIALLLESDSRSFAMIIALLWLNVPCLLLSIRLAPTAITHLLQETGTHLVVVSSRTADLASAASACSPASLTITEAPSSDSLFAPVEGGFRAAILDQIVDCRDDVPGAIILHSSGTTGMPKPIRLAHRYPLVYAGCHTFAPTDDCRGFNLSTLPIYHGFGLLAPCLALSVGMPCCLPSTASLPTGRTVLNLAQKIHASSIMTVPSIMEDMVCEIDVSDRGDHDFAFLSSLAFVAVGGGSISDTLGERLTARAVKLLNHYGATELGALAPIFFPDDEYDWRFLRIRNDMGLVLRTDEAHNTDSSTPRSCRLIGRPFGWDSDFELQDELQANPAHPTTEVRVLGRRDDLLVLATGEKVRPHQLEQVVMQCPDVKRAVAFGSGHFELCLLIEPATLELGNEGNRTKLINHIWPYVVDGNKLMDSHAQITSPAALIVKTPDKAIPTTDKGSVRRQAAESLFHNELDALYKQLESSNPSDGHEPLRLDQLEHDISRLVRGCLPEHKRNQAWDYTSDIFELGIDSLQCVRLQRALRSSASHLNVLIKKDFPYRFNTVEKMAAAITSPIAATQSSLPRDMSMQLMLQQSLAFAPTPEERIVDSAAHTVLLTGSTGSVGAHVLEQLCLDSRVSRIVCLYRRGAMNTTFDAKESSDSDGGLDRQRQMNSQYGIDVGDAEFSRVEFVTWDPVARRLGLSEECHERLAQSITHIIHCAWPMDFNRSVESFEPHVQAVQELCQLALLAHQYKPVVRPRLIVMSSIAAVGHYSLRNESRLVPETFQDDSLVTLPIGYAEGKWVCEQLCQRLGLLYGDKIEPIVIRLGQITGSTKTGYWNPKEHLPVLFRAAQSMGRLPQFNGSVSWLPIDHAAATIIDIALYPAKPSSLVLHVENPIRLPWSDIVAHLSERLDLKQNSAVPYDQWLKLASDAGMSPDLTDFYQSHFMHMATGFKLQSASAQQMSDTLRSVSAPDPATLAIYVKFWQQCGIGS